MINQNELRIGNLVMGKHLSVRNTIEVYKIAKVNWNGSIMVENRISRFEEDMEDDITPIPLTEELLLKCGFVKRDDGVYELNVGRSYLPILQLINGRFNINLYENSGIELPYTPTVHQLQNLYFALTGQELNIEI